MGSPVENLNNLKHYKNIAITATRKFQIPRKRFAKAIVYNAQCTRHKQHLFDQTSVLTEAICLVAKSKNSGQWRHQLTLQSMK